MRSLVAFMFLTWVTIIVLELLIAWQSRLVIERLDALEAAGRTCDTPFTEPAKPQREPWPEIL